MPRNEFRETGLLRSRISLVAVIGVTNIMLFLGSFLVQQYRDLQLEDAAAAGGLYVEGFLAPLAHEFFANQKLSVESKTKLVQLLKRSPVSSHFKILKIWDSKGNFVFSTDGTTKDEDEPAADMAKALQGEILVEIYTDTTAHLNAPLQPPYLEIHAPILDQSNRQIIAVGEIYQDASAFLYQRSLVERSIWIALGISSAIGLGGLIFLISVQRKVLLRNLSEVTAIAEHNKLLKDEADRTRIEATKSNEQLLTQIGAEIHDGPIQMLTLMLLMGSKTDSDGSIAPGMSAHEIGNRVIAELRSIAAGLSLPEITDLALEDVILLAIAQHEAFTGQKVATSLTNLPESLDQGMKICCYRFVQEGLTNSYKHAGGVGQRVFADVNEDAIWLAVTDSGSEKPSPSPRSDYVGGGIGLLGLRHRLDVFGGKLELKQKAGGATELTAKIPLK